VYRPIWFVRRAFNFSGKNILSGTAMKLASYQSSATIKVFRFSIIRVSIAEPKNSLETYRQTFLNGGNTRTAHQNKYD